MTLVSKSQRRRRHSSWQAQARYSWHLLQGGPSYANVVSDFTVEVRALPSPPLAQVVSLSILDASDLFSGHISLGDPVPRVWRSDRLQFPKQERVVTLELFGEREWIASLPDARIFAEGKAPDEAKRNLLRKSRRDLQFLRRNKSKLGSLLQQKLNILQTLF